MKTALNKQGQPPAPDFSQMQTCEQRSSNEGRNGHEYVKMRMHKNLSYWLAAREYPLPKSRLHTTQKDVSFFHHFRFETRLGSHVLEFLTLIKNINFIFDCDVILRFQRAFEVTS